jgi:uncharacterized SAM-dependent methyltransferase
VEELQLEDVGSVEVNVQAWAICCASERFDNASRCIDMQEDGDSDVVRSGLKGVAFEVRKSPNLPWNGPVQNNSVSIVYNSCVCNVNFYPNSTTQNFSQNWCEDFLWTISRKTGFWTCFVLGVHLWTIEIG